jgi:hypothetical protein
VGLDYRPTSPLPPYNHERGHILPPPGAHQPGFGAPAPPLHPRILSAVLPIHQLIAPLITYKTFMQRQSEDLSPDEYHRKYDDYTINYLYEFSSIFFDCSKSEVWFQDRYNPLRFQLLEQETRAWSIQESDRMKNELLQYPDLVIKNMCLEKSAIQSGISLEDNLKDNPLDLSGDNYNHHHHPAHHVINIKYI